ncbi:MAG: hypothetical protein H6732_10080 [Alphaproteobacteria bacterium]|nr:hypothetical protein [Alphaproteobacteria bacterium]
MPADAARPQGAGQAWRWTVPDGVTRLAVSAWGAGGGGSVAPAGDGVALGHRGGAGGFVLAEVEVTPGDTLVVVPGRAGDAGGSQGAGTWTAPLPGRSWLGGGGPGAPVTGQHLPERPEGTPPTTEVASCFPLDPSSDRWCTGAGAGGGWSGVFLGEDLDDLEPARALVVAGGGGGAGAGGDGGAGGGARGRDAPVCGQVDASFAGTGGTARGPGGGGLRALTLDDVAPPGGFGAPLQGGSGGYANPHLGLGVSGGGLRGGGGGGGGWQGGGGGANVVPGSPACGGGGGSGWAATTSARLSAGAAPDVPAEDGASWGRGGAPGEAGGAGGVRIQW